MKLTFMPAIDDESFSNRSAKIAWTYNISQLSKRRLKFPSHKLQTCSYFFISSNSLCSCLTLLPKQIETRGSSFISFFAMTSPSLDHQGIHVCTSSTCKDMFSVGHRQVTSMCCWLSSPAAETKRISYVAERNDAARTVDTVRTVGMVT